MSDISAEVCYALPDKQFLIPVKIHEGATVEAVILASGILSLWDDVDLTKNKVGIFSRPAKLTDIVSDGDRVEIYRPLIADPKEMRRKRAEDASRKKKEG
ncbi:RnfH family protein [Morganella morganii]|uniref:RnfH family protein n=1 Tax=Morganella morganii TaxID=582 RepID=UPI0023629B74|nr:RnfH family protein [Morganella morganii]